MRLVGILDPALRSPAPLQKLILDLHTPEGLLLNREPRNLLFAFLNPTELANLLRCLNFTPSQDFQANLNQLAKARIFRDSDKERALFNFFELPPPQREAPPPAPTQEACIGGYPLFAHQRAALRALKQKLSTAPRRAVLHMPTGSGKTRTAMNFIADYLRQNEPSVVIWLAYSEELCEQAIEEFQKAWEALGNRPLNAYRFWGGHELQPATLQDGFVVAGLAKTYSAAKRSIEFISTLGSRCSLVIIDEAHSAIAETYSLVLDALVVHHSTTMLLGLTATPGRTWNEVDVDAQLAAFFAQKKVMLEIPGYTNPVEYLVAEGYLAQAQYVPLFYQGGLELSPAELAQLQRELDIPDAILRRLAEDEKRNLSIIQHVEDLAKRHQRILVFAATVEHSDLLATVLRARGLHAHSLTSHTPPTTRAMVINDYKNNDATAKILCNYGILTTGFDAPRTSATLIARPTKSLVLYSQMIGRAIRGPQAGGNAIAEVVTVIDHALPGFRSVAEAFTNWEDIWE